MAGYIGSRISNTLASLTGATGTLDSSVSFANIANDAISGDKVDGGTISNATLASTTTFPSDMILQVVQAKKTTAQTISTSPTAITGLSQSITVGENSKVLIMINLGSVSSRGDGFFYLYRGGTQMSGTIHTDSTTNAATFVQYLENIYHNTPVSFMFLDESITSAGTYTYQPYAKCNSTNNLTINKRVADTWSGAISTIILMEVSA